jgi:hypothetical protein
MSREPAALDDRLDALAARVRRQRVIRGVSLVVLLAVVAAVAIAAVDASVELSVAARTALELAWFLLIGLAAWRLAARPWLADPPVDEVAERMMADDSPNVVAALAREERHHHSFPLWPGFALAALAVAATFTGVLLAAKNGDRVRRVALPWHNRAVIAPFEIIVVTGDAAARRGEPVTLTAYLKPNDAGAALPDAATLAIRGGESIPMTGLRGAFHATLPAPDSDFEYRIEAGNHASEWHAVRLADSVELAAGTKIAITPPEYAAPFAKPSTADFADVEALQYSTAVFHLKFSRPAESAAIEWRPEGRNSFEAADPIAVSLSADRLGGAATLPLRTAGRATVILVNESGPRRLRTEASIGVRVKLDAPPEFLRIDGLATTPRSLRPGLSLPVSFAARAGFGPPAAIVEYSSGSTSGTIPVLVETIGTSHIEGRALVDVPSLAKDGTLRLRVKLRDSHRIPDQNLGPQETVFPPGGWFELTVAASAAPFDEQQILGQRDAAAAVIAAARERLAALIPEVEELQRDPVSPLPVDQLMKLNGIRERLRETRVALDRHAAECRLTSALGGFATSLTAFSDGPLRESDDELQQAAVDGIDARLRFLKRGAKKLGEVVQDAERLEVANRRLAQNRLDRSRLQMLAHEQKAIANSTGDALAAKQRTLIAELTRIIASSEPLSRETSRLAANESARLANEARTLARRIRDLDAAIAGLNATVRKSLLEDIATAQTELAKRIAGLSKGMVSPFRVAALPPPKREDFDRVADSLKRDKLVDALTEAERLALAMEKLADDCEHWSTERADAKLAAGQFAKWQADLKSRFLADRKAEVAAEQKAILISVERMRVPADAAGLKDTALVHLRLALRRLETNAPEPEVAMKLAVEALDRLGTKLPTLQERLARSLAELNKIRGEHDSQIMSSESLIRTFDRVSLTPAVMQTIGSKLGPVHTRQIKLMDRVAALDLPTHDARQAGAVATMKASAADLKDGLPYDVIASLGAVRRELDRLKLAIEGQIPADVRAVELASKQSESLRLVLAAGDGASVKAWEPVVQFQREIAAAVPNLAAPEAPGLLFDARKAAELAESALRDGSTFDTIVRRLRDSKEALLLLADRLNDRDPERDRVKRFVAMRRTAECQAKKFAGRPANNEASAAAKAELERELAELAMTRVGTAAQAAKRKALELCVRLQNRPEPDRLAADQRQLADALAEVASHMANEARLTTRPDAEFPLPDPVDDYLPSKKHAAALREAARVQREIREQANGVPAAAAERMTPAASELFTKFEDEQRSRLASLERATGPWARAARLNRIQALDRLAVGDPAGFDLNPTPNEIAARQRARHAELAAQARELAFQFADADHVPDSAVFAESLRSAEQSLIEAGRKSGPDAAQHRSEAFQQVQASIPTRVPAAAAIIDPVAAALRDAERAMQRAIRDRDPQAAKHAAEFLRAAAGAIP